MAVPNDKVSLDFSYNYNDVFSRTNVCYVFPTATPPAPPATISPECALAGGLAPPQPPVVLPTTYFYDDVSFYNSKGHFVSANVMWKPVRRVTTNLGYTGTFTNGNTLILTPNVPVGPLQSNYHLPSGWLAVELARRWTGRFAWNYYGYNEKADPGFTGFRDVRGNMFTLGLKYAF